MNKLDRRVRSICGSVNLKDYSVSDVGNLTYKLVDYLNDKSVVKEYYFIFHTETDTLHFHYILIFNRQQMLKTWILKFSECLGLEEIAINIDVLAYRNAHLRYMLHIDEESKKVGKKVYDISSIVTNMNPKLLSAFIHSKNDSDKLDIYSLELICVQCMGNIVEIMEFLDLTLYHKYRFEIGLILEHFAIIKLKFDNDESLELPF